MDTLNSLFDKGVIPLNEQIRSHLERYFKLAIDRFESKDFPLSFFFASTLFEELAKVVMWGRHKLFGAVLDEKSARKHLRKYAIVVANTLRVNSRVSRIYGSAEQRFARWFRTEELFQLRNRALYIEIESHSAKVVTPSEAIAMEDAYLMICIAGEAYAELQGLLTGMGPEEWQRILTTVDQFREEHKSVLENLKVQEANSIDFGNT